MELLKQETIVASDCAGLGASSDCILDRFIKENEGNPDCEPESARLKAAHATLHSVVVELVRKRSAGQPVDFDVAFAPYGEFNAAATTLISAIWRLENKLHSLSE